MFRSDAGSDCSAICAVSALANARALREEQRARAGLETLVETCPVGVVVPDAATAAPLSLNREARRILAGLNATHQRSPSIGDRRSRPSMSVRGFYSTSETRR